jgi:hypothetical protein
MKIVIALNSHVPVASSSLTVCADGKLAVLALDVKKNETFGWRVNFK